MATMHVDIVAAEGEIFSGEAAMVFAPASQGDVGIAPRPVTEPPIYIGGHTPAAIRRAAAQAGWIAMNHSPEELAPTLATLGESSAGRARCYVIATQALDDDYVGRLQAMGVNGVVVMPWEVMGATPVPLEEKLAAMAKVARYWQG